MKGALILVVAATLGGVVGLNSQSSAPSTDNAAPRDQGRRVFTEHCGKCHDADALKKLSDGSTLLTRLSASKDSQTLLGTRLKTMTAADRRAVSFYVGELLSEFQSSEKK